LPVRPKLLIVVGLFAAGGIAYGADYLVGGIERITEAEAEICVKQIATVTGVETDVNLTNRGGGDVVYAKVVNQGATAPIAVMVIDGGDDAPTKGWEDGAAPNESHALVGNTAILWWDDPQPPGLGQLADCLHAEQKDA
jgi:hypothetical protein